MRVVCLTLAAVIFTGVIAGCGGEISSSKSMDRQQKYGRLAMVCAPKEGGNPVYAPLILKQSQSRIFPLDFLEKVDCLPDVTVDPNSIPPSVQLDDFSSYDAIMAMLYSYDAGHVYLDLHMIDTMTFEQIWHHRLDSPDPDIKTRLFSQGLFAPAIIREDFYGL